MKKKKKNKRLEEGVMLLYTAGGLVRLLSLQQVQGKVLVGNWGQIAQKIFSAYAYRGELAHRVN